MDKHRTGKRVMAPYDIQSYPEGHPSHGRSSKHLSKSKSIGRLKVVHRNMLRLTTMSTTKCLYPISRTQKETLSWTLVDIK